MVEDKSRAALEAKRIALLPLGSPAFPVAHDKLAAKIACKSCPDVRGDDCCRDDFLFSVTSSPPGAIFCAAERTGERMVLGFMMGYRVVVDACRTGPSCPNSAPVEILRISKGQGPVCFQMTDHPPISQLVL